MLSGKIRLRNGDRETEREVRGTGCRWIAKSKFSSWIAVCFHEQTRALLRLRQGPNPKLLSGRKDLDPAPVRCARRDVLTAASRFAAPVEFLRLASSLRMTDLRVARKRNAHALLFAELLNLRRCHPQPREHCGVSCNWSWRAPDLIEHPRAVRYRTDQHTGLAPRQHVRRKFHVIGQVVRIT